MYLIGQRKMNLAMLQTPPPNPTPVLGRAGSASQASAVVAEPGPCQALPLPSSLHRRSGLGTDPASFSGATDNAANQTGMIYVSFGPTIPGTLMGTLAPLSIFILLQFSGQSEC